MFMAIEEIGDPELVRLMKAGDEAAWNSAFRLMYPIMVRTARGIGLSSALMDDTIQDTWTNVFRHIDGFEERSSLRTWITRIFVRQAFHLLRKQGRYVLTSVDDSPDPIMPATAFDSSGHWAEPPSRWPASNGEQVVADREAMEALQQALTELPEQQRAIFTLREIDGLESEEITELLGLSDGNQRVLLHRARHKLRLALDVHYRPAP
jgi:RNA polymerase sigma-70 factor (ECF subfamily)